MSRTVHISDELYNKAKEAAVEGSRSIPMQLAHWAKIAQSLELNKDGEVIYFRSNNSSNIGGCSSSHNVNGFASSDGSYWEAE